MLKKLKSQSAVKPTVKKRTLNWTGASMSRGVPPVSRIPNAASATSPARGSTLALAAVSAASLGRRPRRFTRTNVRSSGPLRLHRFHVIHNCPNRCGEFAFHRVIPSLDRVTAGACGDDSTERRGRGVATSQPDGLIIPLPSPPRQSPPW